MAAATGAKSPKNVTIRGRLSFPVFTYAAALARNPQSQFPKKDEDVTPEFNLLIEQAQLDKLVAHIKDEFIPYAEAQNAAGEKTDGKIDPKFMEKIKAFIDAADWSDTPPNMPIKVLSDKNQESAPEAVASIKIIGSKMQDTTLKATVYDESQLVVPDPDVLSWPTIKPINETVFSMYPGCYVVVTLNLFAYFSSSSVYGISAAANTAVYMGNMNGERFGGGGVEVDEDEIFLDD